MLIESIVTFTEGTMKKFSILCGATILLTSCANQLSVSTNFDKENFQHYFSPGKVTVYQESADIIKKATFLGLVEGEDCQQKKHHEAPSNALARTDARRRAYNINANAIVFTSCTLVNDNEADKQCVASTVCFGKAFHIKPTSHE